MPESAAARPRLQAPIESFAMELQASSPIPSPAPLGPSARSLAWALGLLLASPTVAAIFCTVDGTLRCGVEVSAGTAGKSAFLGEYACGGDLAPNEEAVFRFRPQESGNVNFHLTGMATDHDLYVLEGALNPDECVGSEVTAGTADAELTVSATAGEIYFVVVEAAGATGAFTIAAETTGDGACRETCDNGLDDDVDEDIDCDDADCALDYACGPVFDDGFASGDDLAWSCRDNGL